MKMNSNFTSTFFGDRRRLVVAETNFKFVTCGPNILHIAFLKRNQVDDIFRFTIKNLRNRIRPASTSASTSAIIRFLKMTTFFRFMVRLWVPKMHAVTLI